MTFFKNFLEFLTTATIGFLLIGGSLTLLAMAILYGLRPEYMSAQLSSSKVKGKTVSKDSFQSTAGARGVYQNWDKQVNYLKDVHGIGKAAGVLQVYPNQSGTCGANANQNLIVQPNVAFQSYRQGNGCTYVDLRWPNA